MGTLLWVLIAVLGFDLLVITVMLLHLAGLGTSSPTYHLTEVGQLFVGAGVLAALISMALTARRNTSEDFLTSATVLLERAYTTLAQLDELGRPRSNRMNWLASARFLRAAEGIASKISETSHEAIFREHREYWRARFFDLIFPTIDGFPPDYYSETPDLMALGYSSRNPRPPLSEKSLAVLYRFVRWPEGFDDPLRDAPAFSEQEIERMRSSGPRGLAELLANVRRLRDRENR
jgi:hypothetical protein